METEIKPIKKHERPVLENLMQFYFYDFSAFNGADVTETGQFGEYPYTSLHWTEENRHPYFIQHQGNIAGFVLVSKIILDTRNYYSISEFFVLKKFRKLGVGRKAAFSIFDRFTGEWEVTQIISNHPAQAFWRKVIGEFTNENYREKIKEGKIIQQFVS